MKRYQVVVKATKSDFAILEVTTADQSSAYRTVRSAIFDWANTPKLRKFGADGWQMEIDTVEEIVGTE